MQYASSVERASLSIKVRYPAQAGRPGEVAGGRARLYVAAPLGTTQVAEHAIVDAVVAFEDAPVGQAWLVIDSAGMARHTQDFTLEPGPNRLDASMRAGRALDVLVVDESGAPAPGAWVQSAADGVMPVRARSDAAGYARVEGALAQMAHVEATIAGAAEGDAWAAPGASDVRVQVRPMARVRVHVLRADGSAAPEAVVDVVGTRLWPMRTTVAQKDGTVDLRGLHAGLFWVRARLGLEVSDAVSVELKAGDAPELSVAMQAGTLVVAECTDERGAAVAGATIAAAPEGLSPFPDEAHSDARGVARLGPMRAGRVSVQARAEGFVPAALSFELAQGDANNHVKLEFQRGGRVRVVVMDSARRAVAGARVELVGRNEQGVPYTRGADSAAFQASLFERHARPAVLFPVGDLGVVPGPVPAITQSVPGALASSSAPSITDAQGVVELDAVPVGEVRARVHHADYSEGLSMAQLVMSGGTARLSVELQRGGTVEGELVDASGRAAPGYEIRLVGELPQSRTSDDRGRFEFRNIAGAAVLLVQDPSEPTRSLARTEVAVSEGKTSQVVVTLRAEGAPLHVRVTNEAGQPVAMAQVSAVSLSAQLPRRATEFTGNDGYAQLRGFRALESRLDVEAPGYASRTLYTDARTTEGVIKLAAALVLEGRVYSASGSAVAGAHIELHQGARTIMALSDAAGAFRVGGVSAEKLVWRVTAPGFNALSGAADLRARAGKRAAELPKMELQREACVAGMVRDAESRIAPGARVVTGVPHRYRPADLRSDSAVADASGSYRLCGLGLGSVLLRAVREGDVDGATRSVKLGPGDIVTAIDLRLGPKDKAPREAEHGGLALTLGEDSEERAVVVVREIGRAHV